MDTSLLDFFVSNFLIYSDIPYYTGCALIQLMSKNLKEINTFLSSKLGTSEKKK